MYVEEGVVLWKAPTPAEEISSFARLRMTKLLEIALYAEKPRRKP